MFFFITVPICLSAEICISIGLAPKSHPPERKDGSVQVLPKIAPRKTIDERISHKLIRYLNVSNLLYQQLHYPFLVHLQPRYVSILLAAKTSDSFDNYVAQLVFFQVMLQEAAKESILGAMHSNFSCYFLFHHLSSTLHGITLLHQHLQFILC